MAEMSFVGVDDRVRFTATAVGGRLLRGREE
jgi:hypothetical protein